MRSPAEFAAVVSATTAAGEICILYAEPSDFAVPSLLDPQKIWPEMRESSFRAAVAARLPLGTFSAPDDLDGWTFYAYP